MPLQQFVLVVDSTPTDAVLSRCQDLSVGRGFRDGVGSVAVSREAADLVDAVASAVRDLEVVGLRPVRVDAGDWVTLGDIAGRIGRSREIVRLWATGRQGPGGFPPPLNPGRNTSFYSWAEVSQWLRERMSYDVPGGEPVLVAMNLALQLRRLAPRIERIDAVRNLL